MKMKHLSMLEWKQNKRQASQFRSEGEEEAQKVEAATDRDKTIILADAYKKAQQVRGEEAGFRYMLHHFQNHQIFMSF